MQTRILFFFLIFFFLSGCRSVQKETHEFKGDKWQTTEKIKFQVDMDDPGEYDINLKVYYTDKMEGTYFATGLMLHAPFGEERYLERSEKVFKNGDATGKKNDEGYYEYEMQFFKQINFAEEGIYEFEAQSLMPTHELKGIHKIELLIKPV